MLKFLLIAAILWCFSLVHWGWWPGELKNHYLEKRSKRMRKAEKVVLLSLATGGSLVIIAEEYHVGVIRWLSGEVLSWLFAWVWETPWLQYSRSLPGRLGSVLVWMLLITGVLAAYYMLGSLATGVIVGIARRLGYNPVRDVQVTFLLFWPVVLFAMLLVGWIRVTISLLTPVSKMFYDQGITGVDKSVESVTGQTEALIKREDYIDQPVSLFDKH